MDNEIPETPVCCKKVMGLICVNRMDNRFGDIYDYYYQCKKCGKVIRE